MTQIRCAACQLQLCKSRDQSPHAELLATESETAPVFARGVKPWSSHDTLYVCQKCGASLIRSSDFSEVGWRKMPEQVS